MGKSSDFERQEYFRHPFLTTTNDLFTHLETNSERGLDKLKAQQGQQRYGPNKLSGDGSVQWHKVLIKQISNAMILVSRPYPELKMKNPAVSPVRSMI